MKKYTYKITPEKFENAIKTMIEAGARVWDDGSFEVKGVSGKYEYDEQSGLINIFITEIPFLATYGMVEEKLNQFFN